MSTKLAVENLGKSYRKWDGEWRRIISWFFPSISSFQEGWVLRGVNFNINHGEAVGIVGQNGAGKSTLLKLITGTIQPTEGKVGINGRVSAILELGMGFNPDMTGRQNAKHSAGLMGYSPAEIDNVMPNIEDFAEIGDYFDQPVRTYSSGMQMRVAFSVATAFKPDLLIVDEALSVGDNYFQHKSFDRIRRFKEMGVSILFVTHSMADIRSLCDRAILLDSGRLLIDGLPDEVVDYYNAFMARKENEKFQIQQKRKSNGWLVSESGTGHVQVQSLKLFDFLTGKESSILEVGQVVELQLVAKAHENIPQLVLGFLIKNKLGAIIWGTNTWHTKQVKRDVLSDQMLLFKLKFACTLGPGTYSVSPALVGDDTHLNNNYQWIDNLLVFDVVNSKYDFFVGTAWLDVKFSVETI